MEAAPQNPAKAAKAITDRLLQMRQLWEDAADNYFEPSRFLLALQNCITTSRTVTFIMQSNKSDIPNFDFWYQGHVARWSADPVMRWVKQARNFIEKRGDLEAHSQVRAEIIASYLPGPETEWMPQELFQSPQEILLSIPEKFIVPHIIENGTLLIERRWIDSNLPDMEVLEALAHVYEEFCITVLDLSRTASILAPPGLDSIRPSFMASLAMDRAIYLSIRDGSPAGMRFFKKSAVPESEQHQRKIRKRYGPRVSWNRLENAKTLRDLADAYFENARVVMTRDTSHGNFIILFKNNKPIELVASNHPNRASRYVLMRDLAKLAKITGADAVMVIAEAWTAFGDDVPKSGFASEATNRGEALMLGAAAATGEFIQLTATVTRKFFRSQKIKDIGTTVVTTDFPFLFAPFLIEWGCLDEEALQRALDRLDTMGVEAPKFE